VLYGEIMYNVGMIENDFEDFVNKYRDRLVNVSKKIVFNYDDAMDIVQESFLDYYNKKEKFLNNSSIYTYLYKIVLNKSIDHIRKNRTRKKKELKYFEKTKKEEEDIELKIIVEEALKDLPEKYRIPLILLEYDNLTYNEIANILGLSLENVKIIILRVRKKLLDILNKKGVKL